MLLEKALHFFETRISRRTFARPYLAMLGKLYKELMILGLISFMLLLALSIKGDNVNHEYLLIFEFLHAWVFVAALFSVLHAVQFMANAKAFSMTWQSMSYLSIATLRHQYQTQLHGKSWRSKWLLFKHRHQFLFGPTPALQQIEFRHFRLKFLENHGLHDDFDFALYLFIVISEYIAGHLDYRLVVWLMYLFVLVLNICVHLILDALHLDDHTKEIAIMIAFPVFGWFLLLVGGVLDWHAHRLRGKLLMKDGIKSAEELFDLVAESEHPDDDIIINNYSLHEVPPQKSPQNKSDFVAGIDRDIREHPDYGIIIINDNLHQGSPQKSPQKTEKMTRSVSHPTDALISREGSNQQVQIGSDQIKDDQDNSNNKKYPKQDKEGKQDNLSESNDGSKRSFNEGNIMLGHLVKRASEKSNVDKQDKEFQPKHVRFSPRKEKQAKPWCHAFRNVSTLFDLLMLCQCFYMGYFVLRSVSEAFRIWQPAFAVLYLACCLLPQYFVVARVIPSGIKHNIYVNVQRNLDRKHAQWVEDKHIKNLFLASRLAKRVRNELCKTLRTADLDSVENQEKATYVLIQIFKEHLDLTGQYFAEPLSVDGAQRCCGICGKSYEPYERVHLGYEFQLDGFQKAMLGFRLNVTEKEAGVIIRLLDSDRDGSVSVEDFTAWVFGKMELVLEKEQDRLYLDATKYQIKNKEVRDKRINKYASAARPAASAGQITEKKHARSKSAGVESALKPALAEPQQLPLQSPSNKAQQASLAGLQVNEEDGEGGDARNEYDSDDEKQRRRLSMLKETRLSQADRQVAIINPITKQLENWHSLVLEDDPDVFANDSSEYKTSGSNELLKMHTASRPISRQTSARSSTHLTRCIVDILGPARAVSRQSSVQGMRPQQAAL
eukprot:g58831.t1